MEGGHPFIDDSSFAAGEQLLKFVDECDDILFLISGGGSACVEVPLPPFTRDEIVAVNARLVRSSLTIGDIDVLRQKDDVRRVLGYLPQEFGVYPRVSAEALLDHFAILKGIHKRGERKELVAALLRRVNLYEVRKQNLGTFSGGMRQRFGIAQALLGNPKLIIVDEPTAGLDPGERVRFHNLLAEIGENVIVILSTHIVEDVSDLCSRMAIISHGRVLAEGEPAEAMRNVEGKIWKRIVSKDQLAAFQKEHAVISTRLVGGKTVVHVFSDTQPEGFLPVPASLEDVYFSTLHHASAEEAAA